MVPVFGRNKDWSFVFSLNSNQGVRGSGSSVFRLQAQDSVPEWMLNTELFTTRCTVG